MIRTLTGAAVLVLALADILWSAPPKPSALPKGPLEILLPLGRTAYQTNEWIDVSVLRQSAQALPATDLTLSLTGADDSKLVFTFPLPAVAAGGTDARNTEHLHLNGRLLRPGNYTLEASAGGLTGKKDIEIYTHIRKTNFKLGDWGSRAKGSEQAAMGEDSLGFNTFYAAYGGISPDDLIRGGLDYMWNCTMGGGHQMDLRTECDWSDPYVLQGGTARVVRRAFADRTNPNCIGVHFYDEPGLTWQKHPVTKEVSPHNLPAQDLAFRGSFDRDPPLYYQVQPDNPIHQAQWQHWGRWKLAFMDAAWKHAAFGVSAVRPDFLSVTQSVYGWNAFTDGYYFNVARTLPVISGHGGYDDFGGAYFNPGHVFEFGRMRDLARPNWYLPTWYGGMPANRFRMEQYLSFMNNLQGMFKPPDMQVQRPARAQPTADGIVESNKLMARLGTIFTTMPVTRPDVAVLYSISQNLNAQTHDMKDNYEGGKHGRQKTLMTYLAGLVSHVPLQPIVEEDVLDGTLAAHHKAVVLPGINYLDPKVIAALEAFAAKGGTVLVSDESKVRIKGARKLGCPIDISFLDTIAELWKTQNHAQLQQVNTAGGLMAATAPLGVTLLDQYRKLGLKPALTCDVPSVILSRQALGDVEYLFAVNATYDAERGGMNSIKPAAAKLSMPADGRPVYDAVLGEPAAEFREAGKHLSAPLRFGPGQMHVYARTPRPIGGVQVLTPTVSRDYTVAQDPLSVEIGAVVTDTRGRVLSGSIPLQVQVIDPLGGARYDLYRATDRGMFKLKLPLAVNDPAGKWQVVVRELLSNTEDRGSFTTAAVPQCGAIAGATPPAVYFGNERENVYRFFRTHKDITIAIGKSGYNEEAAQRLVRILKPWDIRCRIVNAADIKPRELAYEEANLVLPFLAPTFVGSSIAPQGGNNVPAVALVLYGATLNSWCGLEAGKVAAGRRNDPRQVGFGVRGPVVLLGTPEDNPLIAFVEQIGFPRPQPFLPYRPVAGEFPGRGRGMLAWQRDALRYGDESVTLIAHDSAGMAEAVGSLYEAASGLDPLTQYTLPAASSITVASKAPAVVPEPKVVWKTVFPDRAAALKPLPGGGLLVLTQDGSLTALDQSGKLQWQQLLTGGESWALDVSADGNRIAVGASQHLLAFDSSGKLRFDVPLTTDKPAPPVTFVGMSPDGSRIAAGAVDGKLTLLDSTGKAQWTIGGVKPGEKARPNPYLSGIFTADGKTLVALTANEAHVIDLANGAVSRRTGGVNGSVAPQRVGDDLLLSDGNSAVWFSPADGKIIKRVPLPPNTGVVSLALVGEELIAGTEADGAVRKVKTAAGAAKEQPVWEHRVPRRLVKKVVTRDGQTAVAFWGGLVQVLDKNGAVKAARVFPQDVAGLEWNGAGPVVGLADGELFALAVR